MKLLLICAVLAVVVQLSVQQQGHHCFASIQCDPSMCDASHHVICANHVCQCSQKVDTPCTTETDCTAHCTPFGKEHCVDGKCHCILNDLIGIGK